MNIIIKFVKNLLKEFSDECMGYVGKTAEKICIRQMKKIKPTDEELHQLNTHQNERAIHKMGENICKIINIRNT